MPQARFYIPARRFSTRPIGIAIAGGILLWCLAPSAGEPAAADALVSGNYKQWQVEQPTVQQRSAYRQSLKDGTIRDGAVFDHVVRWKLGELTREENLLELPKLRKQLRYDLSIAGRADAIAAHDRINALALEHLPTIVSDRAYHAGTRYSALLLIGDLNAIEERPFDQARPAEPLAQALPLLVDWLESPVDDGPPQDIIPLGALIGVLRHAQLGIADDALRQRGMQAAVQLAGQTKPPAHRSAEGHDWMRRRAIHLLARLARPGASTRDDEAAELIWKSIDDASGSLKLQVEAALAWSLLATKMPADRIAPTQTLAKLAGLAGRVVRSELVSATTSRPAFAHRQSRRVVAAQLGNLSHACRQLGVDAVALRRSPPPTELATLADLYCGLKAWIGVATDPHLASGKAASALAEALPLLESHPQLAADKP